MPEDTLKRKPTSASGSSPEWTEEQLRYRVLVTVYALTGAGCEEEVAGAAIEAALGLRFEDLCRLIHFLEYHGFLDYRGSGPRVGITKKGIDYIRQTARRRQSIRTPDVHLRSWPRH